MSPAKITCTVTPHGREGEPVITEVEADNHIVGVLPTDVGDVFARVDTLPGYPADSSLYLIYQFPNFQERTEGLSGRPYVRKEKDYAMPGISIKIRIQGTKGKRSHQ